MPTTTPTLETLLASGAIKFHPARVEIVTPSDFTEEKIELICDAAMEEYGLDHVEAVAPVAPDPLRHYSPAQQAQGLDRLLADIEEAEEFESSEKAAVLSRPDRFDDAD
jgi:hypothetical protein